VPTRPDLNRLGSGRIRLRGLGQILNNMTWSTRPDRWILLLCWPDPV